VPGKDVFLSYASEDRDRIRPLVSVLEGVGWTVFWDRTIPAGKTWREVVGKELENCRSMVVTWSQASIKSDWVLEEADRGRRRGILIPVRIDDVEPPLGFGAIQAADLSDWDGQISARQSQIFVRDLSMVLGEPPITKAVDERGHNETAATGRRLAEEGAVRKAEEDADPKGIPSRAWENFKPSWADVLVASVHKPQNEREEPIEKVNAYLVRTSPESKSNKSAFYRMVSIFRELIMIDGRLILTNQRVLFEGANFNITRHISPRINALLSAPVAIPLSAIESVTLSAVPYRIKIRCHSGEEYVFGVPDRKQIIAKIEACRKQFQSSVAY
jgi:hypothetical protein